MRFLLKIILLLCAVFALSALILPFVEQSLNLSGLIISDLRFLTKYGSIRVFARLVMVFSFVGFFIFRKELGFVSFSQIGYVDKRRTIDFFYGFLLALCGFVLLASVLICFGYYKLDIDPFDSYMLARIGKSLGAAFLVAFLEETLFRGFVLQTFLNKKSLLFSIMAVNVLYALVHFISPAQSEFAGNGIFYGFDFWKSILVSIYTNIDTYIFPFYGLFILGVLFSFAYVRTGALYLSLGLHAGFVFAVKMDAAFMDNTRKIIPACFYDKSYAVGGMLSWIVLAVIFLVIWGFTSSKKTTEER